MASNLPQRLLTVAARASLLMLLSCGGGGSGGSGGGYSLTREGAETTLLTAVQAVTDADGVATGSFLLPSGTNKATVTASTDAFIATDLLVDDLGTVYASYDGELVALSTSFDSFVSTVTAPSRDFDPPLSGSALTMQTSVGSSVDEDGNATAAPGRTVSFTILAKNDSDLAGGSLPVNIIYVGPASGDAALKAAMTRAADVFTSIYSSQAGIVPVISQYDFGGPAVLPDPSTGDALYLNMSAAVPSPAVNVCVGFDLTTSGLLGESSGIPGPPVPTFKSCVGVSAVNAAGADGVFSDEDVRVLGETIAHEIGHYMGLFHPVEADYASFDPLIDTPTCGSEGECDGVLGSNNMYYTPIADGSGALIPQSLFTSQQRGVLNRYAAVD